MFNPRVTAVMMFAIATGEWRRIRLAISNAVAGPGQDHGPDAVVILDPVEEFHQKVVDLIAQRVEFLWTVQRQQSNIVFGFKKDLV